MSQLFENRAKWIKDERKEQPCRVRNVRGEAFSSHTVCKLKKETLLVGFSNINCD